MNKSFSISIVIILFGLIELLIIELAINVSILCDTYLLIGLAPYSMSYEFSIIYSLHLLVNSILILLSSNL